MKRIRNKSRERGAALVIGLILLGIITLLAVVGMNISNAELASATSEQVRLRAFQAAESGVEFGVNKMFQTAATCGSFKTIPPTPVEGSPINSASGLPTDHYEARVAYIDESAVTDGYSSGTFASFHYNIEARGTSSRNSIANHVQGAYKVNQTSNQNSFRPLGTDCFKPLPSTW